MFTQVFSSFELIINNMATPTSLIIIAMLLMLLLQYTNGNETIEEIIFSAFKHWDIFYESFLNYRGQRTGQRSYNSPQPPKRLLPKNGLLFDSDIASSSDNPNLNNSNDNPSTSLTDNKYPLQSVYIGEIWRFCVKISNKLNENLHNFGLLCHIEMNLKSNIKSYHTANKSLLKNN